MSEYNTGYMYQKMAIEKGTRDINSNIWDTVVSMS